jgi:hypothetical protein
LLIEIEETVLKKACMEIIETIFFCLPNAFKGTIYRVGKMPDLIVERIASGVINEETKSISWGLPSQSGYTYPGRSWSDYRDEPGRPLEAMGWCVERQKSWTAEDPLNDSRSVRLQVEQGIEDFQHMEPVLLRKSDLNLDMYSSSDFPRNYAGDVIWQDSDYVVAAVVKIHFRPYTIRMNSDETRVIKKLSRTLGTELLSYQLRQNSMKAMQDMSRDRLNACNILADSLRNAISKSGLIFSLVKQEIGHLRDQWERALLQERNEKSLKAEAITRLNNILADMDDGDDDLRKILNSAHNKFLELSLPPGQGKRWIEMQIEARWSDFITTYKKQINGERDVIHQGIDELKRSLQFGMTPEIIADYKHLPDDVKNEWVSLLYDDFEGFDAPLLERLIYILSSSSLNLPSQERSRKALVQLKVLAETMRQLERNTNFLLHQVLNGNGAKKKIESINNRQEQAYAGDF